jgi:cobalamin 5'-phosphate synthase/cobalamin synthase
VPVRFEAPTWQACRVGALAWYPAVGGLIGLVLLLCGTVLKAVFIPSVVAVLLLVAEALLTGAIHWDGLADTADGLGSHRPAGEQLRIMRDSRVGTYGAAALTLNLLLRHTLWTRLLESPHFGVTIPVGFVVSRWLVALAAAHYPYARPTGLGAGLQGPEGRRAAGRASLAALVLAVLVPMALVSLEARQAGCITTFFWPGVLSPILVGAAASYLGTQLLASHITSRLGGLTGDVYGAVAEIGHAAFLLGFMLLAAVLPAS